MKFDEDVSFQIFARWWLREREEQLRRGTVAAATLDANRRAIDEVLLPTLHGTQVREIDFGSLEALREATVHIPERGNEVLALARQILARAEQQGIRPPGTNPALHVRPHAKSGPTRRASAAEVNAIVKACEAVRDGAAAPCHPTHAAIFQFMAITGVRPCEARDLRWHNVDQARGVVWLQRHKAETAFCAKRIVLNDAATTLLNGLCLSSPTADAPVFPSHRTPERPYRKIDKPWKRLAEYAGLGKLHLSDLSYGRTDLVSDGETSLVGNANHDAAWRPGALKVEGRLVDMSKLTFSKDVPFGIFAAAWLSEREAEFRSGELAERTFLSYRRTVRGILIPALAACKISDVSTQLMRALRRETSHIPAKGNQALNLARRILNVAETLGLRPPHSNPTQRVKPHPELAAARPASPMDVHTVTQACEAVISGESDVCHPNLAKIFLLVALTGARPSEIRDLRAGNLDLDHGKCGVLRLHSHKTAGTVGEKLIVLGPEAREAIDRLGELPSDSNAVLFPSHRCPGKPYRDISKAWRRLATEAGLDKINLRDLRSGLATNAHETGVEVKEIQGMLGHNDVRTTMGYIKLSARRVGEAYEKVEAARAIEVRKRGAAKKEKTVAKKAKTVRKKNPLKRRVTTRWTPAPKWGGRRA